jgi:hypothetical protein
MKWTIAGLEGNWEYETFASKEEAIEAGKMEFDSNFLIATVEEKDHLHLVVDNIEEVDRWEETPSMKETLLKNLAWKCFEGEIDLDLNCKTGSIHIWDYDQDLKPIRVTNGYIKDWKWATPEEELIRIHAEISKYIAEKEQAEHVEVETEVKFVSGGPVTDQERMMREAGHKLSDFE